MKPYVIVKLGTSQHKITVGEVVTTDRIVNEVGEKFTLNEVLMSVDGDNIQIGTPLLNIPVEFEVVSHHRGERIRVHKFKAKSHYKLTNGHRSYLTQLKVVSINGVKEMKNEVKKVAKKEVKDETTEVKATKVAAPKAKKKTVTKK